MSTQTIDVRIQAVLDGFAANLASANASVQTTVAEMKGAFASLGSATAALSASFGMITGVLAGGAAFKAIISTTREWTSEVVGLAKRLGLSTEEASALAVALQHVGMSTDDYGGYVQKLTRQMRTNGQAFETLGIRTRDQNGQWRNSQDVMQDAITKLAGMKEGTDRNVAASALFGARVGALGPLLRLTSEAIEEARMKAIQFGLIVGPEGSAEAKKYKDAIADVKLAWTAMQYTLGRELLPMLADLAKWFGKEGPTAVAAFKNVLLDLEVYGEWTAEGLNVLAASANGLGKVMHGLATGNYAEAGVAWAQMTAQINNTTAQASARVAALKKEIADTWARLEHPERFNDKGTRKGGNTVYGDDFTKTKDDAKKKLKEEYEARLASYKDQEELEKDHLERVLAIRQRMYADATATFGSKSKEALTALREVHAAERAVAEDQRAASGLGSTVFRDGELAKVQIARDALAQRKALGEVSDTEALAAEQALADREYAIRLAEFGRELQLYADQPKKLREIQAEITRLQQQHGVEIAKNAGETATALRQSWQGVGDAIGNGLGNAFTGFLQQTTTLRGAFSGMVQDMERMWAGSVAKMVSRWITGEATKTGVTAAATAQRLALEAAALVQATALHVAHAVAWIATEAAKAAAAAWSALAGVPFIGPVLAPVAAAATLAGVLALGSKIASASGGYDIPAGVNPMTQLHAEEMVLPAHLANPMREMLAGGGSAGGDVHIHVSAVDAHGVRQFFDRNRDHVARAVKDAVRNNVIPRPSFG